MIPRVQTGQSELYSFWKSIPLIKRMEPEKFDHVKQVTRSKIIEILRKGIEDANSDVKKRYALNAQEIQEILTKEGLKTSLQNTYFHINILLEEGFIQEITILKEGRFNKRYYGRTAKLFLFTSYSNNIQEKMEEGIKQFSELINVINDEKSENHVENMIEEFLNNQLNYYYELETLINAWFEKNAEKFIEHDLDVKETYQMIFELVYNGNQSDLNKKMIKMLKLNENFE